MTPNPPETIRVHCPGCGEVTEWRFFPVLDWWSCQGPTECNRVVMLEHYTRDGAKITEVTQPE